MGDFRNQTIILPMKKILPVALLLVTLTAVADCDHLYPKQKKIHVPETVELCNSWYVSNYDDKSRKVVLVSELFDGKTGKVKRMLKFHSDDRAKFPVQNKEYNQSGWDRGHLAPAGDAGMVAEMRESFLLTNVVPQAPKLNRGPWRNLEQRLRDKTKTSVYILTGAVYGNTSPGRFSVPVPAAIFKVAYFTSPEFWYAENTDDARIQAVSREFLEKETGLKLP
jgi:endonuclease G